MRNSSSREFFEDGFNQRQTKGKLFLCASVKFCGMDGKMKGSVRVLYVRCSTKPLV